MLMTKVTNLPDGHDRGEWGDDNDDEWHHEPKNEEEDAVALLVRVLPGGSTAGQNEKSYIENFFK